jgi:glycosyltransferase involved in cell wall biosynthesis
VQRASKFVKYLPQCGWLASVLTVSNPSVPLMDASLVADSPKEALVRRSRTWEPGQSLKSVVSAGEKRKGSATGFVRRMARRLASTLLQPDPQILWVPGAIREGRRLLREVPHAAVMVTAPPFSSFLVGASLSRTFRLPLVLDYRDEWNLSAAYWENRAIDPISRRLQSSLQMRLVRAARFLLATTRHSAQALEAIRDEAGSRARVSWIYNGFDPEDFPQHSAPIRNQDGTFRLAYVGTLWNLTTVAPLVEAVKLLVERRPTLAPRLELVFAGRRTGEQQRLLDSLKGLPCRLVEHEYLEHDAALELLQSASALCVLLSDLPGAGRVVPAKLFECMAARRPILSIAPPGEVWDLLSDYPAAQPFQPKDTDGIARYLADAIEDTERTQPDLLGWDASRYDRRNQAMQLAAVLDSLSPRSDAPRLEHG